MEKLPKREERLGQYATKASAARHAKMSSRKHKVLPSACYRYIGEELVKYECYTVQLQD